MDQAHKWTEKELRGLESRIRSVYTEAQKDLDAKTKKFWEGFAARDKVKRQKLQAGEITEEQYQYWLGGQVFQGRQWQAKVDQITDTLYNANSTARSIINGEMDSVFAYNANWASYSLEHQAGLDFGFGLYDSDTVARLIRDEPDLLPKYEVNKAKDSAWNQGNITRQITQGIIQGEGIMDISKRIQRVTGMNMNSSMTAARTAMTGAQNAGRQQSLERAEQMGIKVVKEWLATLDGHTRTTHQRLDGQRSDVKGNFSVDGFTIRFPGDPQAPFAMTANCRCTMIGDLVDYPDEYNTQRYDNISGQKIQSMSYQEWRAAKAAGQKIPERASAKNRIIEDGLPDFIRNVIGFKTGPDSIETALPQVNLANYKTGFTKAYHWNCQRCVSAYELRRRGYNVEAMAFDGKYPEWFSIFKNDPLDFDEWVAGSKNYFYGRYVRPNPNRMGRGPKGAVNTIEEAMGRWGDGSRAVLSVSWKGTTSAHIINVENVGGVIKFVDSQCGEIIEGHDRLLEYMSHTIASQSCLVRIDNKPLIDDRSTVIARAVKKKEEKK